MTKDNIPPKEDKPTLSPKRDTRSPKKAKKRTRTYMSKKDYDMLSKVRKPLSPVEEVFVDAYTNKNSKAFNSAKKSYQVAHPRASDATADSNSYKVANRPNVKYEIMERLSTKEFKDLYEEGIRWNMNRPDSKNWAAANALYQRTLGLSEPDKIVSVSLTREQQDEKLDATLKRVYEARRLRDQIEGVTIHDRQLAPEGLEGSLETGADEEA